MNFSITAEIKDCARIIAVDSANTKYCYYIKRMGSDFGREEYFVWCYNKKLTLNKTYILQGVVNQVKKDDRTDTYFNVNTIAELEVSK